MRPHATVLLHDLASLYSFLNHSSLKTLNLHKQLISICYLSFFLFFFITRVFRTHHIFAQEVMDDDDLFAAFDAAASADVAHVAATETKDKMALVSFVKNTRITSLGNATTTYK